MASKSSCSTEEPVFADDVFSDQELDRIAKTRPRTRKADAGLRARLMTKTSEVIEWTAIETGTTRVGVPDIYGVNKRTGESFWVECKKKDGKLSPAQIGWIRTHMRLGVSVYIAEDFMGGWMILELGTDNVLRGSSNTKMLDTLKAVNYRQN